MHNLVILITRLITVLLQAIFDKKMDNVNVCSKILCDMCLNWYYLKILHYKFE